VQEGEGRIVELMAMPYHTPVLSRSVRMGPKSVPNAIYQRQHKSAIGVRCKQRFKFISLQGCHDFEQLWVLVDRICYSFIFGAAISV